jgi:hypothetical protein
VYWLQTVPGLGKLLRLVRVDAIHDSARGPRVQACVSSCRLVTCAKAAAGKRYGPAGTKIGTASRTWACSEAAVLLLRHKPRGQKSLARLENTPGQGKARTRLAHKLARAISDLVPRRVACALDAFLPGAGRRAGEPAASRGHHGGSLTTVLGPRAPRASTHARAH